MLKEIIVLLDSDDAENPAIVTKDKLTLFWIIIKSGKRLFCIFNGTDYEGRQYKIDLMKNDPHQLKKGI